MDRSSIEYIRAVREVREDPRSKYCFVTGESIPPGGGDPHHVLPVAQFPQWAEEKINIVIVSRKAHNILTDGTAAQIARLPRIHNLLARMIILDEPYYNQFYEKLIPYMNVGWK